MQTLHQLGHNQKWGLDSYFENQIGNGFIFGAYNLPAEKIGTRVSGYKWEDLIDIAFLDLQFYASKHSDGGKLSTYRFHPINLNQSQETMVEGIACVEAGINLQIDNGFRKILIPSFYQPASASEKNTKLIRSTNKLVQRMKKKYPSAEFYMTLCISKDGITDESHVENLLTEATDIDICFDGYYIVIEPPKEYKQKIPTSIRALLNTKIIFETLKKQGFKTIWAYANWDASLFSSLVDFDYITIGTYENLRSFSLERFLESQAGGPSKGWYYSEKLLNFIKAQDIEILRAFNCLDAIKNDKNIFSEIILNSNFIWNTHKPEVHKNYLLAIDRELKDISSRPLDQRKGYFLSKINTATNIYTTLSDNHKVLLSDESSNYHLHNWANLLNLAG